MGKDDHSKTRKDWEEVIQAAGNLVYLGKVIKEAYKFVSKNRGDDLE